MLHWIRCSTVSTSINDDSLCISDLADLALPYRTAYRNEMDTPRKKKVCHDQFDIDKLNLP